MEEYVWFGMNVSDRKTKLAKRVYILISIFNILLIFFNFLETLDEDVKKAFFQFIDDNIMLYITFFSILFIYIIVLPERNNKTLIITIPIWIMFILLFTISLSVIL